MLTGALRRCTVLANGTRAAGFATAADAAATNAHSSLKYKVGLGIFGGMTIGTTCLGMWQTQRYFWKLQIIEQRQKTLDDAPALVRAGDLPQYAETYQPLMLQGRFDHRREMYLGVRAAPKGTPQYELQGSAKMGYYVLTPFVADADGVSVVVNRGWIPQAALSGGAETPVERPEGSVTIRGVFSPPEPASAFKLDRDPNSMVYHWLDAHTIARETGAQVESGVFEVLSAPVAAAPAGADGGPRARRKAALRPAAPAAYPLPRPSSSFLEFYVSPSVHATYAGTWYALAFCGVFLTRHYMRRARMRVR